MYSDGIYVVFVIYWYCLVVVCELVIDYCFFEIMDVGYCGFVCLVGIVGEFLVLMFGVVL